MDQITQYIEPVRQFSKDSIRLVKRCTKPDRKGEKFNRIFFGFSLKMLALDFCIPELSSSLFIRAQRSPSPSIVAGWRSISFTYKFVSLDQAPQIYLYGLCSYNLKPNFGVLGASILISDLFMPLMAISFFRFNPFGVC